MGEACWWTVHPASKQRSEGEKVRVGDDLILVSVATERYLVCSQWFSKISFPISTKTNQQLIAIVVVCHLNSTPPKRTINQL